jgi:cytochrome c oxidase assembly protein subunit 15
MSVASGSAGGTEDPGAPLRAPDAWRHRFAVFVVAATLVLIFAGGLVTSTGSGLSVPDWPLSYGMLMPPMVGGIRFEHTHRLVATSVGFFTLVLAFWTARREPRRGVRGLAWGALAAVVVQGVLGGLTVIYLLPTPISVSHACLAQTFFCLLIALAYMTSREWQRPAQADDVARVRSAAIAATAVVYLQLVFGAIMRHVGAGLALPGFPSFQPDPEATVLRAGIHLVHRLTALAVLAALFTLAARARRSGQAELSRPARLLAGLGIVQFTLGALTVLTAKAVVPTTLHVVTGAAVLGGCWFLTLRAFHLLRPLGAPQAASMGAAAVSS